MGELLLTFGEDGKAHMYNSDFDVTIHCEDEQQMNEAVELLNLANRMHWRNTAECPPKKEDGDSRGDILAWYSTVNQAGTVKWDIAAEFPSNMPFWMPLPEPPEVPNG